MSTDRESVLESLLPYTSPEFQAEVHRKKLEEGQHRRAELEREHQKQDRDRQKKDRIDGFIAGLLTVIGTIGFLALAGGVIYLLVKLVQWAWMH